MGKGTGNTNRRLLVQSIVGTVNLSAKFLARKLLVQSIWVQNFWLGTLRCYAQHWNWYSNSEWYYGIWVLTENSDRQISHNLSDSCQKIGSLKNLCLVVSLFIPNELLFYELPFYLLNCKFQATKYFLRALTNNFSFPIPQFFEWDCGSYWTPNLMLAVK